MIITRESNRKDWEWLQDISIEHAERWSADVRTRYTVLNNMLAEKIGVVSYNHTLYYHKRVYKIVDNDKFMRAKLSR